MLTHRTRPPLAIPALALAAAGLMPATLYWTFFRAPFEATMGAAQKIFYLHVPAAMAMYAGALACTLGSAIYLYNQSERADAVARAGAEMALFFGAMGVAGGSLWGKAAWGAYWSWEPRTLSTVLQLALYAAYLTLRDFAGDGEAERKFAAALGVLAAANVPIISYSVKKWGGNHPGGIIEGGGRGLGHVDMKIAFWLGVAAMVTLAAGLIATRARLHLGAGRLAHAEGRALELGLLGDEA
ncbi:MAG TPA: cytochrome c biogenesis protein CcsA [Polyangiaceae bacterium]|nr:cytochrome c biogenesis protein CcsA [Polyangiaceae bacterium]